MLTGLEENKRAEELVRRAFRTRPHLATLTFGPCFATVKEA
jgi:hypothetical protein